MPPIVQIAGVQNLAEAQMLLNEGADYLGFPLHLNFHQPDLSDSEAAAIIKQLNCGPKSVLITYLSQVQPIVELCRFLGVASVQLHGAIELRPIQELRQRLPEIKIIKSLIVQPNNLTQLTKLVQRYYPYVDAFLTDTFDPTTGACGATGKTHDWQISREIVDFSPRPVILAGGLNPYNVCEAILTVQPAGVDAHTGLEDSSGYKDPRLVRLFIQRARQAFATIETSPELPVELPIDGVLDLHTFAPREVKDLVPEYLEACRSKGILTVRIIHGKGSGTLRETVHAVLRKLPYVAEFRLADETGGSWGATIVNLFPTSLKNI
jgi:phosphoribosylanthranilate isomerase